MYSFQVDHYATSDNLVSQSLHAFSLRHLHAIFLHLFYVFLVTAARWFFELTELYKLVALDGKQHFSDSQILICLQVGSLAKIFAIKLRIIFA